MEESLYQEMMEGHLLQTGKVTTTALAWKTGLDQRRLQRFRTWGVENGKIRVVTRIPSVGDDWGSF
jgi:hypothetical protein